LHPAQERSPIPYSITRAAYTNKQKKQISAPNYLHRNSSQGAPHLDPENKHELHKVASPGAVIKKEKKRHPHRQSQSRAAALTAMDGPRRADVPIRRGEWCGCGWEATAAAAAAAEMERKGTGAAGDKERRRIEVERKGENLYLEWREYFLSSP